VPLASRHLEILDEMEALFGGTGCIWKGHRQGQPVGENSVLELLRRMGVKDAVDTHGFRSTFSDWGAEKTEYSNEVLEMALAHTIPNKVEAAYRRGDLLEKRRHLMQDWADYCLSGLDPNPKQADTALQQAAE
jgi:integrase